MKNLLIASAALLGVLSTPMLAAAQDDVIEEEVVTPKQSKDWFVYGDANFALMQFSVTEGNTEFVSDMMTAAFFRAGVKYKYFGAEVEYGTGLSGIEEDGISIDVNSQTSVFGIVRLPADKADVYLRLGYHSSDIEFGIQGVGEASETDSGFAGGIGGSYFFTDNLGIRLDITSYNLSDPLDVSYVGGSAGAVVRF